MTGLPTDDWHTKQQIENVLFLSHDRSDANISKRMTGEIAAGEDGLLAVSNLDMALDRLSTASFDLILVDFDPVEGWDPRQVISELTALGHAPVIVLARDVNDAFGLACMSWGAEECLSKDTLTSATLSRTAMQAVMRRKVRAETAPADRTASQQSDTPPDRPYASLMASSRDPVLVVNGMGHVVDMNPLACDFFGLSETNMVGTAFGMLLDRVNDAGGVIEPHHVLRIADTVWKGNQAHILSIVTEYTDEWSDECPSVAVR